MCNNNLKNGPYGDSYASIEQEVVNFCIPNTTLLLEDVISLIKKHVKVEGVENVDVSRIDIKDDTESFVQRPYTITNDPELDPKKSVTRIRECLMGLGNIIRYQIVTEDGDKIKFRHSPAQSMDSDDIGWFYVCDLVNAFENNPFEFDEFASFYFDDDITDSRDMKFEMIFSILENEGIITASAQGLRFYEVSDSACSCVACADARMDD